MAGRSRGGRSISPAEKETLNQEYALNDMQSQHDYEPSGLPIQRAMLDAVKTAGKKKGAPPRIRWGVHEIQTSDCLIVPSKGRIRITFLSSRDGLRQGVDIKVNGTIYLLDGSAVETLRTWRDPKYEDTVEYEFASLDGMLRVWNVYEVRHESNEIEEAKWTDNAGFWIEEDPNGSKIYHCSAGPCVPPDFEALVFKLTVLQNNEDMS